MSSGYSLLDCGDGRRLERFGDVVVSRPAPAATDEPGLNAASWNAAQLRFTREGGWQGTAPEAWRVPFGSAVMTLRTATGGQLGVFPEHAAVCDLLERHLSSIAPDGRGPRILNLFAHTGLATLRLAAGGAAAEITHVDAAPAAVRQARENADASGLADAPVRWLADDAMTFLRREVRRERAYEMILADPPAFGRSKKGGEWKLERDLPELLSATAKLLAPTRFVFCLTCHREGWNGDDLRRIVSTHIPGVARIEIIPLRLTPESGARPLEAGYACLCLGGC